MKTNSVPWWFRLPPLFRMLWLVWNLVCSPFRRRYSRNAESLHAVLIIRDLYSPIYPLVKEIHAEGIPYSQIFLLNSGSTASECLSLLKDLSSLGCQILTLDKASLIFGPYVIWLDRSLSLPHDFWSYPFLLTDPDLDLSGIPHGWLQVLIDSLNKHSWASKAALGLRTDDLSCPDSASVQQWENQLSQRFPYKLMNMILHNKLPERVCPTDTTLALYRPLRHFTTLAIRLEGEYRIRHLPWYSYFLKSEEYSYYQQHKNPGIGKWSTC